MRSLTLVFLLLTGVTCFAQSVKSHTFSSAGGGSSSGSNFKLSGALGQPVISTSTASSVRLESGFMPSVLAFSNNFAPSINFDSITKSPALGNIQVEVTDTDGIEKVKLHYRPIAELDFDSVEFAAPSGNVYVKNITSDLVDAMGIEFYFSATDITGKRSVLPSGQNRYFQRYSSGAGAKIPTSVYNIGSKKEEYRIITVPYNLTSGIGPQLNELADDQGQHSTSRYRIATYAGNDTWNEYPSSALTNFTRGKGYWFLTTVSGEEIFLENASTPENFQGGLFMMRLKPLWNQIGNPYTVPISWADVQAYNPGIKVKGLHVYKDKKEFESGDELQPFEGGFVYLDESSEKDILIPFLGQEPGGGRIKSDKFSDDIASDAWKLNLKLQLEDRVNELAAIGMHPEANDGNDYFDDYHPPRFTGYTEINFPHPEYHVKNFAKDIVARQDSYAWSFSIDASEEGPYTLQWNNENLGNNSIELYLVDENNTQLINMREKNAHPVSKNVSYRIYYGENILSNITPEVSAAGIPYPNPWTIGRSEDIHIPFALPGKNVSHHVTVEIVDISGRTVKQIMNTSMISGFYEATWSGKDHQEETCSQGLYLLRLKIENSGVIRNFYHRIIIKQQL